MNWVEQLAHDFPTITLQGIYEMKNYHLEEVDGTHDVIFSFDSDDCENVKLTMLTVLDENGYVRLSYKWYDYLCTQIENKIFLN